MRGTGGPKARFRFEASCAGRGDCGAVVKDLRLESSNRGGMLHVKPEGPGNHKKWNIGRDHDRLARGERRRSQHVNHDSELSSGVAVTLE